MAKKFPQGAFSWMMYDWANSAFATTIMAGFFPIFFGNYWSHGSPAEVSTFWLGLSVSIGGIIVAVSAPIIGAIADKGRYRKYLLLSFAGLGIVATGAMYLVQMGQWPLAALLYIIATIGFQSGDSLYNSLLTDVSTPDNVDTISGMGFSLGYLGGGVLFTINVAMTLQPQLFGLVHPDIAHLAAKMGDGSLLFYELTQKVAALTDITPQIAHIKEAFAVGSLGAPELTQLITGPLAAAKVTAVKLSFLSVAIWWGLFSLPLAFNVKEKGGQAGISVKEAVHGGFSQLMSTFKKVKKLRYLFVFLLAYWLYIDAVDTIIVMAIKIGQSLGFSTADLITALLLTQFVGFPFAWLYGWLGQKFSPRPLILSAIVVYMAVTILAYMIPAATPGEPLYWSVLGLKLHPFFILAFLIGTVQGGIQALSRSYYSRLIPKDKAGEFFGFYNMLGKFAAIFGPILVGGIGLMTGSVQTGLLSLLILFVGGGVLLLMVDEKKAQAAATQI